MKFEIPDLPYAKDALAPHISPRTLEFHYEKHHKGYLEKLRKAIEGKPEADKDLEDIIRSSDGDVFNFAAQVWNHTFYWRSLSPDGGGKPDDPDLAEAIQAGFGSLEKFKRELAAVATGEFGSGWAWVVVGRDGRLRVTSTTDGENTLIYDQRPILTIDVWEHAYYLDYQNERAKYVEAVIDHLLNWDFARENLKVKAS